MKKRIASEEEQALFKAVLDDQRALDAEKRPKDKASAPAQAAAPSGEQRSARPAPGRTGLDGRTAGRLKRGLLEPDARLDMHGMTEAAAHRTLLTFVKGAHARGDRLLLVVTGKGSRPETARGGQAEALGVLRMMTPRWLEGLAEIVADWRVAHRRHGGDGALYVYLRKPPR
jgi:DNA-nicking Smr family endonuclease